MSSSVYIELMKVTTQTNNNSSVLSNSLWVWGNYDFIKVSKYNDKITNLDPIFWLKKQYENNHSSHYDGIEHQPLFLWNEASINQPQIIDDLVAYQTSDTHGEKEHMYLLTLLQLDYHYDDLKDRPLNILINSIINEINTYSTEIEPNTELSAQVFFNIGESDIAILFRVDRLEAGAGAIAYLRSKQPIAQNYTLIIFPYNYLEITNVLFKNTIATNITKWLTRNDKSVYDTVTHFVVDNSHQGIIDSPKDEFKDQLCLIFGDYDVQLVTNPGTLIKNTNPANPGNEYRYSKTTPQLMLSELSSTISEITNNDNEYIESVNHLNKSFIDTIDTISKLPIPRKENVVSGLESAQKTLINLHNFFIKLHESRYAPDVYLHMQPIFTELENILKALNLYCCNCYNNLASIESTVKEVEYHIKSLTEHLQQFLAIVSLSPQTFSESHTSYMRSANAALKLLCAYHAVVYIIHNVTKCTIDGSELQSPDTHGYERSECAVLILPSRDAKTKNKTLFPSLSAEHHISVIQANFTSMFQTKEMLFHLTHEVGHFSGNRKRYERRELFINASLRYMIFTNKTIWNTLTQPYYTCANIQDNFQTYGNESDAIFKLDQNQSIQVRENIHKCISSIGSIADYLTDKIIDDLTKKQSTVPLELSCEEWAFKYNYLDAYIEYASKIFEDIVTESLDNATFNNKVKEFSDNITQLMLCACTDICNTTSIPRVIKYKIKARVMEDNKHLLVLFKNIFRDFSNPLFEDIMYELQSAFEDVYSDIFAINILHIEEEEYVKMILNNEVNKDVYNDQMFLIRFFTVLQVCYNNINCDKVRTMLTDNLPLEWHEDILTKFETIYTYPDIFISQIKIYANMINSSNYNNEKLSIIQDFYRNPGENLYSLWIEGMNRKKGKSNECRK